MNARTKQEIEEASLLFDAQEEYLEKETAKLSFLQPLVKIPVVRNKKTLLSEQSIDIEEAMPDIRIAISCINTEQLNFICSTAESISEYLGCNIYLQPNVVDTCTHLVVDVDRNMLCARTQRYVKALVKKRSVVSFLWYIDLFDISRSIKSSFNVDQMQLLFYLKKITRKHIVKGDRLTGVSDAALLAHTNPSLKLFFCKVNIYDPKHALTEKEIEMIRNNGGFLNKLKTKRKTVFIKSTKDLYDMVTIGSLSSLHSKHQIKRNKRK